MHDMRTKTSQEPVYLIPWNVHIWQLIKTLLTDLHANTEQLSSFVDFFIPRLFQHKPNKEKTKQKQSNNITKTLFLQIIYLCKWKMDIM